MCRKGGTLKKALWQSVAYPAFQMFEKTKFNINTKNDGKAILQRLKREKYNPKKWGKEGHIQALAMRPSDIPTYEHWLP